MHTKKWIVSSLAVAAIAASLFFLLHTPAVQVEQAATDLSIALGTSAAQEIALLIGHEGKIAVIEMELNSAHVPTVASTMKAFRKTLKQHDITVARTKALPGGTTALMMGGGSIAWSDYSALVAGSPNVDAVVTFARLPDASADELHEFQTNHPPLVVVDLFGVMNGPAVSEMVDQKTVALALMPQSAADIEQHANEPKIFDRYYRILRPSSK